MSFSRNSAPTEVPLHVLGAIEKAEALGQPQVVQAIKRAEMLRQQRVAQSAERRRLKDRIRKKAQREEQKRRKIEERTSEYIIDGEKGEGTGLSAASGESRSSTAPSKNLVSVSGTKMSTSSTPQDTVTTISKAGCYKYLPAFDKEYFCGYCHCGMTTSWHYRLIPAVSVVPMIQMLTNDDNSNYEKDSDGDTDGESNVSPVTVASTPFKTAGDTRTSSRPAVVTPPEKTSAPNPSASVKIALKERGINYVTRQADRIVAEQFNSDNIRAAVFGQAISRPLGDRKLPGKIAFSWYPPKYLPVFGDGSGMKRMRKEDIVGHGNHIIQVGKSIMKQSEWNVDEAEADVFGSSTKYHTLLVHDPNIPATEKAGLSIIYFKPVAKYFWLSFITTASSARRVKKEDPGRGYGRMILWRLINLARNADGIEEIYLEVNPEWTTAIDLYRSFQFEEISWNILPKEIEAFEFKVKANDNPECMKVDYESLFKHNGEYTLMRLKLSVLG